MNYRTTVDGLRVRTGPGTDWEIVKGLPKGSIVKEVPTKGWCLIEYIDEEGDTINNWVSRKYLEEVKEDVEPTPPVGLPTGKQIVAKAMTQNKDPYIFGYEVDLDDPNPYAFDCSELVQWDCHQLGVKPEMPDGARNQYLHCKKYGTLISIAEAVRTPGALLFRIYDSGDHVVISRGDGSTIEAKGSAYGVGVWSTADRGWNYAARIPGVVYA